MALHPLSPSLSLNVGSSASLPQERRKAALREYEARVTSRENRRRRRKDSPQPRGAESRGETDRSNRLTASESTLPNGYTPPYEWFCPEEPLLARRCRTEQRREELLQLLYQKDIQSGDIDELVSEWVSLLVERDKLLHEQVHQDYCVEYFRDLRRLLHARPSLEDGREGNNLRQVLVNLERCVTEYCRKRNLLNSSSTTTPSSQKPLTCSHAFAKPVFFHAPPGVSACHTTPTCSKEAGPRQHITQQLDHETGQTSVQMEVSPSKTNAHTSTMAASLGDEDSSGSLFKETEAGLPVLESKPHLSGHTPSRTGTQLPAWQMTLNPSSPDRGSRVANRSSVEHPTSFLPQASLLSRHTPNTSGSVQPPPRPVLPPPTSCSPPPIPPSPPLSLHTSPTHHPHRLPHGVTGTVQFAGMSSTLSARQQGGGASGTGVVGVAVREGGVVTTRKWKLIGFGKEEVENGLNDLPFTPVQTEDRRNLLDEISSMGHSVLKRTSRPRSPGGTPVKATPTTSTATSKPLPSSHSDSDMLQRALLSKFRSLHSTPLQQQSRPHHPDYSSSLDFSNAWSNSLAYEDPDISTSPFGSFVVGHQSAGSSRQGRGGVHNSSTAV